MASPQTSETTPPTSSIPPGTSKLEALKYLLGSVGDNKALYSWRTLVAGVLMFLGNNYVKTRNDSAELQNVKSIILAPPTDPVRYPGQLIPDHKNIPLPPQARQVLTNRNTH